MIIMNPTAMTNNSNKTFKCVAVNNSTQGRRAFYCSTQDKALREARTYLQANKISKLYTIIAPVQVFSKQSNSNEIY